MRVLVTSTQDLASQTIKGVLIQKHSFTETGEIFEGFPVYSNGTDARLITTTLDMIHSGHLSNHFDAEVFIFCSRHRAASGKPALLVHSTGNFSEDASFGGCPNELSISTGSLVATALKHLYREREKRDLDHFDVTLEVTHHGPTSMNVPLLFIELGSDENYWLDQDGAGAVAATAMECLTTPFQENTMIGFGGNHYASKFNKLVLEKDIRISHMAPKHALDKITHELILQMIERSYEKVSKAVIDWKGTNAEQKARILPYLDEIGIEVVKAKSL